MLGGWPAGGIWLSTEPADMRRSFDGLCALVATHLGDNPAGGRWYVFVNRRRTMVKVLGFEHGGLFIWAKRLEQGLFASPLALAPGRKSLSLKAACGGDLGRVTRCVKLGGFVNSTPDFTDQPEGINGASDLIVAVFGDRGKHARFAVSAPSLPSGIAFAFRTLFQYPRVRTLRRRRNCGRHA